MPTAIHEHQIQPNHFIYRCLMLLKSKPSQVNSVCRYTEKTMEQYSEQWLNRCKLRVKESTLVKYHNILEKHISPVFNSLPISQVTSELVQQFTEQLLKEKKLSPKTVRDILTVLKAILSEAEKEMGIAPFDCKIQFPQTPKKEIRVLTVAEQHRLVTYLLENPSGYHLGILLSLFTGMRLGEVCALKWHNVSLSQQTIRVETTMQRIKNLDASANCETKITIDTPKSIASIRTIPLTTFVQELLLHYKCNDENAFVLTGQADQYIEPRVLQYRLARCAQACQITNIHFHTLRHTFATRCAEVGFEIKSLSEILGHSDSRITLDRYVHPSMETKRRNMEKLSPTT